MLRFCNFSSSDTKYKKYCFFSLVVFLGFCLVGFLVLFLFFQKKLKNTATRCIQEAYVPSSIMLGRLQDEMLLFILRMWVILISTALETTFSFSPILYPKINKRLLYRRDCNSSMMQLARHLTIPESRKISKWVLQTLLTPFWKEKNSHFHSKWKLIILLSGLKVVITFTRIALLLALNIQTATVTATKTLITLKQLLILKVVVYSLLHETLSLCP